MSRQPTLKQLRYLISLAEHGHFGHAARACHVSQSTLSAGILELEDVLGAPLVERNNRRVILTLLGEEVVQRGKNVMLSVEDIVACCRAAAEPFNGAMRIGVIPTIAPFILPGLLKRLRDEHPDFRLFIREDLSENLTEALSRGELDVLLLALPYPVQGVDEFPLFEDEFLLACPEGHPLASLKRLTTKDLKGADLLLLEDGHCLREHALEACKLRDSDVSVPYQATSLNTIVQMVANGIGVTLLPKMALDANVLLGTRVQVSRFSEKGITRTVGLMWRRNTPRQPEFRQLGAFIREAQRNVA
ncbi:MAG: hydrogen peroxide-inducible genes activator [Chromatocurvus sp.]